MPTKTDNQSIALRSSFARYLNGDKVSSGTNVLVDTWVDSRTGVSLPNWRRIIARGQNATTGYSATFKTRNCLQISSHATVGGDSLWPDIEEWEMSGHLTTSWGNTSSPTLLNPTAADRSAREQFIQRYRGKRTAFQAGVALGEMAKLVKMIKSPASALRRGIDSYYGAVKKRSRGSPPRRRMIQDTWLEYQMGWKPLINDIENLARLGTAHPYAVFENISGSGTDRQVATYSKQKVDYGPLRVNYTLKDEGSIDVKYKGAVSAVNEPPAFPEQLGLSWSNVLPTVWELIPYSFLVDYFTNVGKVIDGISTGRVLLAWGCRTEFRKNAQTIDGVHIDQDYLKNGYFFGGTTRRHGYATGGGLAGQSSIYSRSSVSDVSFGLRDARFKLPGTNTKWLNIAALANLRR